MQFGRCRIIRTLSTEDKGGGAVTCESGLRHTKTRPLRTAHSWLFPLSAEGESPIPQWSTKVRTPLSYITIYELVPRERWKWLARCRFALEKLGLSWRGGLPILRMRVGKGIAGVASVRGTANRRIFRIEHTSSHVICPVVR